MGGFNTAVGGAVIAVALAVSAVPAAAQIALPDGEGKAATMQACLRCHGTDKLAGADNGHWPAFGPGKSRDEWQRFVDMMASYGTAMTPAQSASVVDYLAAAFPGAARPAGVRVDGPVAVVIRDYPLRAGTRPHDPAVAPDGSVWYTGQASSVLGRLDPHTGQLKEYRLAPDNARLPYGVGPHGLIADRAGNIWYAGQMDGHIGRLDPVSGAVTKFRMPDPSIGGPHTPLFDRAGTLWFTLQQGNRVARMNVTTGEMAFATMPVPKSEPYGIVISSTGVPFVAQLMGNRIARIDPVTLQVREYFLGDGTGPRRIAITPDDVVFYTDYARGRLGRLDPVSGATKEWLSPGGPLSQPYAITVAGDAIWYVEGNTRPNMLVRFEPRTERFQTWPLASGGGVVRHMVVAPDGTLWLAGSEIDALISVTIGSSGTR